MSISGHSPFQARLESDQGQGMLWEVNSPFPAGCARRYRCEKLLASGGHGRVFLAIQEELDRPVAIKLLAGESLRDPMLLERFRLEARLTARVNHPHIVRIVDHDIEE